MAIITTSDLTDITLANTTTDSGTFYRLNGTTSGNPAADGDAMIQGVGCVANKMGAATGTTDVGGHFDSTATFDLTNKHIYHWRQIVTAGNMLAKASRGVTLGLTNTSTTSTTAWSTTNFKQWFLDGSDTIPSAIGWQCYVLDPTSAADVSAGTLTLTTVKNIGFICRQNTGVTTTVSNQFVDAIRMGTGMIATTSVGTDVITMASLFSTDKTNSWGIITQFAGIYYGAGKINVGSATQTNVCNLTDSSQVLVWKTYPVSATLYQFLLKGASGNKTTVQLTSCVIRGQTTAAVWTITCNDAFSDFKAYSCAFANISSAALSAGSVLSGSSVAASGTITTNGAAITNCTFSPTTSTTQVSAAAGTAAAAVSGSTFTSAGTGHGLEITGTATNTTLTNDTWSGYAASNGSTGNEAVFVNIATGSMNLTITGGTTPSVRTAGATVTVVSGAVNATITVQNTAGSNIQNARVLLLAASGGPMPYNVTVTISNAGTTATVTHAAHGMATNDKVQIKGASLQANNGVFAITYISTSSYSYTMASTPGSSPTGTIQATYVALSGLTDINGQITMSRVFSSNQPVNGRVRLSTGTPIYKTSNISGTINSSLGFSTTILLISDE